MNEEWKTMSENIQQPHLPAGRSCHVRGCAAGQYNDLHEDDGSFVQIQTEEPATPAMQRVPSVE